MRITQAKMDSSATLPTLSFFTAFNIFENESSCFLREKTASPTIDEIEFTRRSETSTIIRSLKDIDLLEKNFIFHDANEIKSFLWRNNFLLDYLFESHHYIIKYFGKSAQLHLELNKDFEENYEALFVVIKTSLSSGHALELLNRFDSEWFLNILGRLQGKLNITTESL